MGKNRKNHKKQPKMKTSSIFPDVLKKNENPKKLKMLGFLFISPNFQNDLNRLKKGSNLDKTLI